MTSAGHQGPISLAGSLAQTMSPIYGEKGEQGKDRRRMKKGYLSCVPDPWGGIMSGKPRCRGGKRVPHSLHTHLVCILSQAH